MKNLTDALQEYGISKKNAQAIKRRVEIYDYVSPRNPRIDCVQLNDDNTVDIVEIDPSTGKTSHVTCAIA